MKIRKFWPLLLRAPFCLKNMLLQNVQIRRRAGDEGTSRTNRHTSSDQILTKCCTAACRMFGVLECIGLRVGRCEIASIQNVRNDDDELVAKCAVCLGFENFERGCSMMIVTGASDPNRLSDYCKFSIRNAAKISPTCRWITEG